MRRRRRKSLVNPIVKQDRGRVFNRRAFLVMGAQGIASLTLFGRLYYLSVVHGQEYRMLAEENRVSVRLLAPRRGRILDRDGRVLAGNRQDYRVYLIPEQVKDLADTLYRLGQVVDLSPAQIASIKRQVKARRGFLPITVRENLDWESFARINVESAVLPGVQPDSGTTRWYPEGMATSQLVGYVGTPAPDELTGDPLLQVPGFKLGKQGIEKAFDPLLRGAAGSAKVEVNAYGRVIRELDRRTGQTGRDISLTIDRDLQRIAAARLGEESAGVIVMDMARGDILVHASTPSYDSNEMNIGISRENWQALLDDPRKPLVNKCTYGQYPPGSTFKMVVALAALKAQVIEPDERVFCNSRYPFGDRVFHCWKRGGHGWVDMHKAIAQSCDCYFYDVANRLGIAPIAAQARAFGLGQTYDLELPGESRGLVPTEAWKRATLGQPWVGGDTLNVGIGQGALLATPLQLAVMTARLANGGKAVLPHLIHALDGVPVERRQAPDMGVDPAHLALIRTAMRGVLELRGTAYASRLRLDGVAMAGKTGTAQVRRITQQDRADNVSQDEKPWAERHHAWFVGFAPYEAPRYAIAVFIEHGGGGSSAAAPVARDIMQAVLETRPVVPKGLVQRA